MVTQVFSTYTKGKLHPNPIYPETSHPRLPALIFKGKTGRMLPKTVLITIPAQKSFNLLNNKFHIPRKILTPSIKAKRNMMMISIVRVLEMSGYGKIVPVRNTSLNTTFLIMANNKS